MGYFLLNPLRRLRQDPKKIVSPYVKKDMRIIEVGPGMGYFSIPMARLVGDKGKIIAVDLQERMLKALEKRAHKAGMHQRIDLKLAKPDSLCLEGPGGTYDFALAFAVVHELPNQEAFFRELAAALKPKAMLLMADPESRFSPEEYDKALALAAKADFHKIGEPVIWKSRSALLQKNAE